jgi:hypothetical protein
MSKILNLHNVLMTFFLMLSTTVLADPFDDGIEPPPTTPIDSGTIYLLVLSVLFAAYYFYTSNFKSQKK